MSRKYIPTQLRRWLESLTDFCEYCQTAERVTGIALDADHIEPRSRRLWVSVGWHPPAT